MFNSLFRRRVIMFRKAHLEMVLTMKIFTPFRALWRQAWFSSSPSSCSASLWRWGSYSKEKYYPWAPADQISVQAWHSCTPSGKNWEGRLRKMRHTDFLNKLCIKSITLIYTEQTTVYPKINTSPKGKWHQNTISQLREHKINIVTYLHIKKFTLFNTGINVIYG